MSLQPRLLWVLTHITPMLLSCTPLSLALGLMTNIRRTLRASPSLGPSPTRHLKRHPCIAVKVTFQQRVYLSQLMEGRGVCAQVGSASRWAWAGSRPSRFITWVTLATPRFPQPASLSVPRERNSHLAGLLWGTDEIASHKVPAEGLACCWGERESVFSVTV